MAFIQLQDEYGSISTTLFPQVYNEVIGWIKEEQMVYIEGTLEYRNGNSQIKVKVVKNSQ